MKTLHKLTLILAIAVLLAPAAFAQKTDSLAVKEQIKAQNKGSEQQLKVQNKEQTKARYKDEDGNGVCDQCKVQKKEQTRKQTRTRAKKQNGDCSGNMAPQGGGSGCRQGQGNGSGSGKN